MNDEVVGRFIDVAKLEPGSDYLIFIPLEGTGLNMQTLEHIATDIEKYHAIRATIVLVRNVAAIKVVQLKKGKKDDSRREGKLGTVKRPTEDTETTKEKSEQSYSDSGLLEVSEGKPNVVSSEGRPGKKS